MREVCQRPWLPNCRHRKFNSKCNPLKHHRYSRPIMQPSDSTRKDKRGRPVPNKDGQRKSPFVDVYRKRVRLTQIIWALAWGLPLPAAIYFVDGDPRNLKLENLAYKKPIREKIKT